jgi:hypothetical protein
MGMEIEKKIEQARLEETQASSSDQDTGQQRKIIIIGSIILLVVLALLITSIYFLALPGTDTARIRDIFIIFMALASLLLGFALIILIIQLARLTNLLQNEIKPILESTNETVNTLRGTTAFLSENLVQPVIKLNEYLAALQQLMGLLSLGRRREKNKPSNSK